ncbi:AAA domain-containing protein [Beggiatoa leptomitoformis]|uniref:AAA family ATPase n=1 Tax=Beggiatoa leptomitoformis TaxID=288004 RepID=A0A2N9YA58_9GAMM|nr:AAA domain-containing protein [Beggiatoa leptomitoformis]ALG67241.1 AAA family ATPase [Beggiatoa leptomitoformis]AUI67339.1 AAA family ATPase [Beggiatoa leptomitoformis]
MKITCLNPEGINKYEKDANAKMEKEFSSKWRGYSALELISINDGTKEIDFILVTDDRVILLELKNWNGTIRFENNKWIQNGEDRGSSPVKITANKARILRTHIEKSGIKPSPYIEHRVILCGTAKLENFPKEESEYIVKLDDFLKINNKSDYQRIFPKPTHTKLPELTRFDSFFNLKNNFRPREFSYQNYKIEGDFTFKHPQDYYKEYRAVKKDDKNYQALLRRWDLTRLGQDAATQEERADIVLRENKILGYIKSQKDEYKDYYLQPLSSATKEQVTADFCELYDLPHKQLRLNEFIAKYQDKLTQQDRIDFIKILLSHFADLHDIEVAHRDISQHCLWLERPAKITISGFITAYFREVKTIAVLRDVVKAGLTKLPEDELGDDSDPFRRDVFLLGVTSYYIAYNKYPLQDTELHQWQAIDNDSFEGKLNHWFETCLNWTAQERFKNARDMLDAFNQVKFNDNKNIDLRNFEVFRTDNIPMVIYPCVDNIKQGRCHIYQSKYIQDNVIVKIWYGIEPKNTQDNINFSLFNFLKSLLGLRNNSTLEFMPKIIDFGISPAGTFFVQNYIEGQTFDNYLQNSTLSLDEKIRLALQLIDAIFYLHSLDLYHGDLHPKNILISVVEEKPKIYLIDVVSYYEGNKKPCNTAYAPPNYETAQPCEIDYYAVALLICDIFQLDRNNLINDGIPQIIKTLKHFFENSPFLTLQNIQLSLQDYFNPPKQQNIFEVSSLKSINKSEELLSDNGSYYVDAKLSDRNANEVRIWITGVRKKLTLFVKKDDLTLTYAKLDKIEHQELQRNIRNASVIENAVITISNNGANDASELIDFLQKQEFIKSIIDTETDKEASIDSAYSSSEIQQTVSTARIWQTILTMEEEMLPEVEISGSSEVVKNQLHIPHSSSTFDFDSEDKIDVFYFYDADKRGKVGILNTKNTDTNYLVIDEFKNKDRLTVGMKLKLESQQTKSSYQRRKSALERILNGKSVIHNLVNYFDSNQTQNPIFIEDEISDGELDDYNTYDNNGQLKFTLNPQQRSAFRQLYQASPLSLLQGPPGTGKTAFIASFIHYLIKKGQARHILLVSQSHEAVNNAIEGINDLSERTKLDLDIVRFGAEGMLSDAIKHLHVSAIQQKYRETFKASIKARVSSLSSHLRLSKEFVESYFDIVFHLDRLSDELQKLENNPDKKQQYQQKLETFNSHARNNSGYDYDTNNYINVVEKIKSDLCHKHKVFSQDSIKKLDDIMALSFEWIEVLAIQKGGNFEEFLAKTRTLVCGTCVGIGTWHIGVANNQYDWVIIDEAARATASELAIAMQAGKRILLVGDHLQLPPQYNPTDLMKYVAKRLNLKEELLERTSDFERAFQSNYGKQVGATLTTQYRMASAIGNLVSECFYKEKEIELKTGRNAPQPFYADLPNPLNSAQVIWLDTGKQREKSYDKKVGDKISNDYEANVILNLLKEIANSENFLNCIKDELHEAEKMIGIICMYAEQRKLINKKLTELEGLSSEFKKLIKVDTVDSYQGKENHIIILSLTRHNSHYEQGFLKDAQRINVALSRAKDRLIIIGATNMWEGETKTSQHEKNKNAALGRVLKFIREQDSKDYLVYDTK